MAYSTIIVPCSGTSSDPMQEPGPYAWDLSASMQNGIATITKIFNFTMSSAAVGSGIKPYAVCPAEVMKSSGFPVRFSVLAEDTRYKYYGNGTIEHTHPDSTYWTYRAEYTIQRSASASLNSEGSSDDESTPPWKRKPTNVSISFPEVVIPFRMGYNGNNNRYTTRDDGSIDVLVPIVNSAGDIIEAETKKHYVQLSFTYCLSPNNFNVNDFINNVNSINKSKAKVCGLTFPAGSCLLVSANPQYHDEVTDGTKSKSWKWWEIDAVLQYDPSGDGFEQRLLNIGNRAIWYAGMRVNSNGVVSHTGTTLQKYPSEIYHWRSFADGTYGQTALTETIQFGNRECLQMAQTAFNTKFKSKGWTFAFEEDSQMPLLPNGTLDIDAVTVGNSRYQRYKSVHYQEHKRKDWSGLNLPAKGVDW